MATDRSEKMKIYRAKSQAKKYVKDMMTMDEVKWLESLIETRVAQLIEEGVDDELTKR